MQTECLSRPFIKKIIIKIIKYLLYLIENKSFFEYKIISIFYKYYKIFSFNEILKSMIFKFN